MEKIILFRFLKCSLFSFITLLVLSISFACWGDSMEKKMQDSNNIKTLDQVTQEKWEALAYKNIFFGHQSVGNNIMKGVATLIKENPQIKLNIVKINQGKKNKSPQFFHDDNLGTNNNPVSKIEAFKNHLDSEKYDISFMKFCFDDIYSTTNIEEMFNEYKETIDSIKKNQPNTVIIHFTIPLLSQPEFSIKNWIKDILGKSGGYFSNSHNVARNKYNSLLISEYKDKEPLFDLAKYESTYPNGLRETFVSNGTSYFSLVPEYTDDRAHLNEKGRKIIAEKLLIFLADLN